MNKIPLWHQAGLLRSYFPESQIQRKGDQELTWVGFLCPSPLSRSFQVKIHYSRSSGFSVYVLEPKLALAKNCTRLPHVYDSECQKLCLFYPKNREWNASMWMAKTILAWASEWLYFYEMWILTDGQWLGGGVEHDQPLPDNNENKPNSSNGTE